MDEYAQIKPSVNIAMPPLLGTVVLQHALEEFEMNYKNFEIKKTEFEANSDPQIIFDSNKKIEFLVLPSLAPYKSEKYESFQLCKKAVVCCVSPNNPLSQNPSISYSLLNGENAALLPDSSYVSKLMKNCLEEHGVKLSNCSEFNRMSMIQKRITEKSAVSFLYQGTYASSTTVLELPLENEINVCVNLLWRKSQKMSEPAKKFLEFIKDYPLQ